MLPTYELTEEFVTFFYSNLRNMSLGGCNIAKHNNTFNNVAK
jgi:hypothetical protein